MPLQQYARQGFGKHISQHILSGDVIDSDPFVPDTFPDKVMLGIDVFCTNVVFWILCKSFRTFVVDVKRYRATWSNVELGEQVA